MTLLERQSSLDHLERLSQKANEGAGRAVFVCGEAGVGKSTLVDTFLAQQGHAQILRGYCDALITPHALGPVSEIYTQALGADAASMNRDRLFLSLVAHLSTGAQLAIVVIEDLHWADEATLDFVRYLGRRIGRARAMLIATFRDDETGPAHPLRRALGDLNAAHVSRLSLTPLTRASVVQLASVAGQDGSRIFDITGGNPFFVREVISAPIGCVPSTVRDAMLARLSRCSPMSRELAEWVALAPGRMDLGLLSELLGACDPAIDECIERGILLHERDALSFRHELARSAVQNAISPASARLRHARICAALIARHAEVARIVHHAREANDPATVLQYAPEAARRAASVGAHREAAAYFAAALEHAHQLAAVEQVALYEAHAYECYLTNQIETAVRSALRALHVWRTLGDRQAQGRTLRFLSRQHWFLGRQEDALRYARESISMHEAFPPDRDLAMAYSNRSQLEMLRGGVADAIAFGEKAVAIARSCGDVEIESHALNNIGTALISADDEAGRPSLERSLALALAHDLHEHVARAYVNLATTATRRQDVDRAQTYLRDGIAYCDERDLDSWTTYLQVYQARFDLDRGEWERASQGASLLLDHTGSSAITRIPALVVLAQVRMRRGEGDVQSLLDEALECALPTGELQRIGRVLAARAEYAWHRNDRDAVVREADHGLRQAEGHRDVWIEGELLFWKSRAAPVSSTSTLPRAYAAAIRGQWLEAATCFDADRMPFEQAIMLLEQGPGAWPNCESIIDRLGAMTLQARLRELREASRASRKSTQANPYGLTNRELEVLALLSHGHSNAELARRLFLSAKTIDHHVSAILGKLQVRSRVQAVAVAHEMGLAKRP